MTDPISGQMTSLAVESLAQSSGGPEKTNSTSFQEVFQGDSQGPDGLDSVDGTAQLESQSVSEIDGVQPLEDVQEIPTEDFIQSLLREEKDIQAMMERCLNGASLSPDEMLQMQALIYSYSQRVDLTTKVVEKATSGIQQVMNTQV